MDRHARLVPMGFCATVGMLSLACTEPIAPNVDESLKTPPELISETAAIRDLPHGARAFGGVAADSMLRANADRMSVAGDHRLEKYLAGSDARVRSNFRSTPSKAPTLKLPGVHAALSGTGDPPDFFDPNNLPKPAIVGTSTTVVINGRQAVIASSQLYIWGTTGRTDLTFSAKNMADGSVIYPVTTTSTTSIAEGVSDCFGDIMGGVIPARCYLWGTVVAGVTINLPGDCGAMVMATGLHNATLIAPVPKVSFGSNSWSVSFFTSELGSANPVADGQATDSQPPCEEIKQKRKQEITSEGGGFGGEWIIFPPDAPATWHCYADQERTIYGDGTAGEWYTVGVSCEYFMKGAPGDGVLHSLSGPGGKSAGPLRFVLAGTSAPRSNGRAQFVRRGADRAAAQSDVLGIPLTATADELGEAVRRLIARSSAPRASGDVVEMIPTSGKAKLVGQAKAYADLLDALRRAHLRNVDGIGDAPAINILIAQ